MTEPTDNELEALAIEHEAFGFGRADKQGLSTHGFDPDGLRAFARAVLAKWGQPPAVAGEPDYATFALWYADHIGDENKPVRDAALATYEAFATPQPTQAQAGAVPRDVTPPEDAMLRNAARRSSKLIAKGGQHGADT